MIDAWTYGLLERVKFALCSFSSVFAVSFSYSWNVAFLSSLNFFTSCVLPACAGDVRVLSTFCSCVKGLQKLVCFSGLECIFWVLLALLYYLHLFELSSFYGKKVLSLSLIWSVFVCLFASSCVFVCMSMFAVVCVALCRTLWTIRALW